MAATRQKQKPSVPFVGYSLPPVPVLETTDDIIGEARRLLASDEGKVKIAHLVALLRKLDQRSPYVRTARKLLRARPGATFYVSASSTGSRDDLTLSVRVAGVQCGRIRIRSRQDRLFTPMNVERFGLVDPLPAEGAQWEATSVREFLRSVIASVEVKTAGESGDLTARESQIETALLRRMSERGTARSAASLRNHRPVRPCTALLITAPNGW